MTGWLGSHLPKWGKVNRKKPSGAKPGQGIVEFALSVPILLVLMLGTIEAGRLIYIYTSIAAAGREAARYAAGISDTTSGTALYDDCAGIRAAAIRIGSLAGLTPSGIHIYHDTGPADPSPVLYCTGTSDTASLGLGNRVIIRVDAPYSPVVPLVPIPPLTLHSQSAHTVLAGAEVVALTQPAMPGYQSSCDTTPISISVSQPTGPVVTATLTNAGAAQTITDITVVWDTTSGPVLQSVSGVGTVSSSGPIFDRAVSWSFPQMPPSSPLAVTLTFSKQLKSNVILRFEMGSADCSFGQ